ncbi:MAG: hypothetical protein AB7H86_15090 [Blastocatellales bacterium]
MWAHHPTADELLAARLSDGWQPTPSPLRSGDQIMGHAACLFD